MSLLKLSFVLFPFYAFSFSGNECFNAQYDVEVIHKSFPFGLLTKSLSISKKNCEFEISHNEYKYRNRKWLIDVCREPVHIKVDTGSVEVIRKISDCNNVTDEFCKEYQTVKRLIQDDGLIFAEGLKNDLATDHGKTYCSYVLLNEYLDKSIVMTTGFDYGYLGVQKKEVDVNDEANSVKIDPNSGKSDF